VKKAETKILIRQHNFPGFKAYRIGQINFVTNE